MAPPVLTVLDIGHGNAAVLRDDVGTIVIDTGRGDALLKFLIGHGLRSLDEVLLSHADADHIGGLLALLDCRDISIRMVRLNTDSLKDSDLWRDLLYTLEERRREGRVTDWQVQLCSQDSAALDRGPVRLEVVAPSRPLAGLGAGSRDLKDRQLTSNSLSAVIRVVVDGHPQVLLAGDLDETGLANIVDEWTGSTEDGRLKADVLVFPHHGGRSGRGRSEHFTSTILRLTGPRVVVFSIGRGVHGTPRIDLVNELRSTHASVWIACTQLSEHCSKRLPRLAVGAGQVSREDSRCAGSLELTLGTPPVTTPSHAEHQRFIQRNVPNGLCRRPLPLV